MTYEEFLKSKDRRYRGHGSIDTESIAVHPDASPHQREIVRGALRMGRCAVFADTGLGKTLIELDWARNVSEHTNQPVLIVAPLAVARQIAEVEAPKFRHQVTLSRDGTLSNGITITNYENVGKFDVSKCGGVALDESSILKSYTSKTRAELTDTCREVPFRLACTATPAPNDLIEIVNHCVWLGIRTFNEVRALYFVTEGVSSQKWRLKKHAQAHFWRWVSSWSFALTKPSDMGFDDSGYELPALTYHEHWVKTGLKADGELFALPQAGLSALRRAKRSALPDRVAATAAVVNGNAEQWLVWCELNDESAALASAIGDAVEVKGADSEEHKAEAAMRFARGDIRVLVSKPSIFGFGMNWQNCARIAFCGLTYSFEQTYQAIRRCWRFGQTRQVECHFIVSDVEGGVKDTIEHKTREHKKMISEIVRQYGERAAIGDRTYDYAVDHGDAWTMHCGDSVDVLKRLDDDSADVSVFSPPFPAMYAYTDTERDVGNAAGMDELMQHLRFVYVELLRVLKPGRTACIHLQQIPTTVVADGYTGRRDFRGAMIALCEDVGFIYASEVTVDKDPQLRAIRSKDRGLLFKSLATDASVMAPVCADYVLFMRKPGKNPTPIRAGKSDKYGNPNGWITDEEWIEWASAVWARRTDANPRGIYETDTLNVANARSENDERHLCPLQLGVIERCVKLFSNPGELVLSPFAGVGSEGYESIRHRRRFVGIELKPEYWRKACENLRSAEVLASQMEIL